MELQAAPGGGASNRITGAVAPAQPFGWLAVLFAGSGCAALIYEIVWLQMLQLIVGLTAVSLGVLLGVFMGGMCLGSLLFPRWVSQKHHPLRVYALLELGLAGLGVAVWWGMPWVEQFYTAHGGAGFGGIVARAGVAAICLLPPAMLMGATLPALARWLETSPRGVAWIGFCYGTNIAGAVVGCLAAGFYLLRLHDVATATYTAVGLNIAVALMAAVLAQKQSSWLNSASTPMRSLEPGPSPRLIYATIGLSGLTAMGAEVVWTRVLSLLLGGTVYTFLIILAVFLTGLGIGSSVGALLARVAPRPRWALTICQAMLAAAIAWTAHMAGESLPYWPVNPGISLSPWFNFQLDLARCFWAVLPATVLWGASFPLALAAAAGPQDPARLAGRIYAANTLGGIIGSLGFSLLVVSRLGPKGAQQVLIVLAGISALVAGASAVCPERDVASRGVREPDWPAWVGGGMGLAAVVAWLALGVPGLPWGLAAYGRFMATYGDRLMPGIIEEKHVSLVAGGQSIFCTYAGEGLNGPVAVTMNSDGVRSFHAAGKVQASNLPRDMRLQRLLGHLSALGHERPKSVLVVACGAGVTAGSFVLHPSVERIVICDIEPLVPQRVAPLFKLENYDVVNDPRVQVIPDDGRHFLRTTREKFDIITSDPIDPWVKGCAALNTLEYYQMCREHLNPGGVMSLWMPLYENDTRAAKSMISTFFQVFTNGVIWSNDQNGEGYDAVLYGQAGPLKIDLPRWTERLARTDHTAVRESLAEVGFPSVPSLLATYAGQASDLHEWMREAAINSDRNLRLQYLAGMGLNTYEASRTLNSITRHYRFPSELFAGPEDQIQRLRDSIEKPRGLRPVAVKAKKPPPAADSH